MTEHSTESTDQTPYPIYQRIVDWSDPEQGYQCKNHDWSLGRLSPGGDTVHIMTYGAGGATTACMCAVVGAPVVGVPPGEALPDVCEACRAFAARRELLVVVVPPEHTDRARVLLAGVGEPAAKEVRS